MKIETYVVRRSGAWHLPIPVEVHQCRNRVRHLSVVQYSWRCILGSMICSAAWAEPEVRQAIAPAVIAQQSTKGTLRNPYTDPSVAVERGHTAYLKAHRHNCHGRDASRGPSLINSRWVFGDDDDTLFRLIALGSEELQRQGYRSEGRENTYRPMPAQGEALTSDDLWVIIAWLRSIQEGGLVSGQGSQ